jgi:hypothetical protein
MANDTLCMGHIHAIWHPDLGKLRFLGYIVRFHQFGKDIRHLSDPLSACTMYGIGIIGANEVAIKSIGSNYIVTLVNI